MPARLTRAALVAVSGGLAGATLFAASGGAATPILDVTSVPGANTRAAGVSSPNVLSPELAEVEMARGSVRLENGTAAVPYYGYDGNGPMLPAAGSTAEASKTEPDKNVYLVLPGQHGADAAYDYGTHFLFQGHETGTTGYVTRINLDADAAHRVTLLATNDDNGALPTFDGITYDPFTRTLLLTSEHGNNPSGGVWTLDPDLPATGLGVGHKLAAFGFGGFEGIQNDSAGNVYIVEDIGGKTVLTKDKQPNSFVYKYVPAVPGDLTTGVLYALQVTSQRTAQPITFHASDPTGDATSPDLADLHTYGTTFATHWVPVHAGTAIDAPYDANLAAKAAGATPFKRPENGVFRSATDFREFYFTETGDTDATTSAGAAYGGFGGVFKLVQDSDTSTTGTLSLFALGDVTHAGFDNIAFVSRTDLAVVEDAGDTLHGQRNALDAGWLYDTSHDYGDGAAPARFLAEGRDPSATLDAGFAGQPGFANEGDNEITGMHASDGDPTVDGILGAKVPQAFHGPWRLFYTAQHGDNVTWEIVRR